MWGVCSAGRMQRVWGEIGGGFLIGGDILEMWERILRGSCLVICVLIDI